MNRTSTPLLLIFLALPAFVLAACSDDSGGGSAPAPCTAGTLECECLGGGICERGLFCSSGVCRTPPCELGELDCLCRTDGTCDAGLTCNPGNLRCEEVEDTNNTNSDPNNNNENNDDCTEGTLGCACVEGMCLGDAVCEAGTCREESCARGSIGCGCLDGQCIGGDSYCDADDVCRVAEQMCEAGSEGCACDGGACDGELRCAEGMCAPLDCVPGDTGCVCSGDEMCTEGDAVCDEGVCVRQGCTPGTEGCECAAGSCGQGLSCIDGVICGDNTGFPGSPCFDNGTCQPGNRCQNEVCVPCLLGSFGCGCMAQGCNSGLTCEAGVCVQGGAVVVPPAAPRCFTPCKEGFADITGIWRECPADRLMPGCVGRVGEVARECVEGSCVLPPEEPPGCASELECPDFQTCIDGQCYSDCDTNDDCSVGRSCHRHVCRVPCSTTAPECDPGWGCDTPDGERGFCMPLPERVEGDQRTVAGRLSVDQEALQFTNTDTVKNITITNSSDQVQRLVLRKVRHTIFADDGRLESVDLDKDSDGVVDTNDNCVYVPNPDQLNNDADAFGDACDVDDDNDDVLDRDDACPLTPSAPVGCEEDAGCEPMDFPEDCAGDLDNDGVGDEVDNCPTVSNPEQEDDGADGVGNACEPVDSDFECNPAADCPLYWLDIGAFREAERVQEFVMLIEGRGSRTIEVAAAGEGPAPKWRGTLEIVSPDLNNISIPVAYDERPEGHWSGHAFYFATFDDDGLDDWRALPSEDKSDRVEFQKVGNALFQKWASAVRDSANITRWEEFVSVMASARSESWDSALVHQACEPGKICFPFAGQGSQNGVGVYTDNNNRWEVPRGVVELPIGINIHTPDPDDSTVMEGRIDSDATLHYAGNPALTLRFANDVATPSRTTRDGASVVFLEEFSADVFVGGRYASDAADTSCGQRSDDRYAHCRVPWLVPGFTRGTEADADGSLYRYECRDTRLPSILEGDPTPLCDSPDPLLQFNLALAGSNPIPDGRARHRRIRLVDGALINQQIMVVIFEERFASIFADADDSANDLSAYGVMMLRREPVEFEPEDKDEDGVDDFYQGSEPAAVGQEPSRLLRVECDEDLLDTFGIDAINAGNAEMAMQGLLTGSTTTTPVFLDEGDFERVHYLCQETGQFDGAPDENNPELRRPCPETSAVVFFTVNSNIRSDQLVEQHPCQDEGVCLEVLNRWREEDPNGDVLIQDPVRYRCADPDRIRCNDDPGDLRAGKSFYARDEDTTNLVSLETEIQEAFRYKLQFETRFGTNIGFTPEICLPNSNERPYCYDPERVERVRDRVDCLISVWENHYDDLDGDAQGRLTTYLTRSFSFINNNEGGNLLTEDGFR